jgi:undecaprenyl-diphosphatase
VDLDAAMSCSVQAGDRTRADGRPTSRHDGAGRRTRRWRGGGFQPIPGVAVAGLTAAVSLAAFVLLAIPVLREEVAGWDVAISEWIHAFENRDTPLDAFDPFSLVLDPAVQLLGLLLVLATAGLLVRQGDSRRALFLAVGVVGAAALGVALKEAFARPPVDDGGGGGYSFPSGHAVRSLAAAAALAVVAWPTRFRRPAALAGAAVVALIGVAVVYHEWHWTSDVLAGWCVAIGWLACVWLVARPSSPGRRTLA